VAQQNGWKFTYSIDLRANAARAALVTSASQGIGRTCALKLAVVDVHSDLWLEIGKVESARFPSSRQRRSRFPRVPTVDPKPYYDLLDQASFHATGGPEFVR
jgi:hypothetical protein